MAKAKKKSLDTVFILFENKPFTILFFVGIFALLGSMFYLMQSSAALKPSVVISSNGCTVTGYGRSGHSLKYGAYSDSKGGTNTVAIPKSGSISVASGGTLTSQPTTAFGQILDKNGRILAKASQTITAQCY